MHQKIQIILQYIFSPLCNQLQLLHNYGSRNLKAFTRLVSHHRRQKSMTHLCQKPWSTLKDDSRTVLLYKRWNIKMDPYYIHLYNMKYESRYGL